MASTLRTSIHRVRGAVSSTNTAPACATQIRTYTDLITPSLRSGNTGLRATIFGATGFLGRYVTHLLAREGTRCVIPFRGDDLEWRHLKVPGDLGVVTPVAYSPKDEDSVKRVIEGSDIVINLIGKDFETSHYLPWLKNSTFHDTHVKAPQMIARNSVELGVSTLVHVSALAADNYAISEWARTKAEGEDAVRAEAPGATIIRPADIFGPEDRFLNLFAYLYRTFPRVPLVDGGTSRVQPVYVHDVAYAIHRIATSTQAETVLGQVYDLAGPDIYTHREIVEYVFETIRARSPHVINVSPFMADMMGAALEILPDPRAPRDRFLRMQTDNVLDMTAATKRLHDLDIQATSMEMPGLLHLSQYVEGQTAEDLGVDERKDLYHRAD